MVRSSREDRKAAPFSAFSHVDDDHRKPVVRFFAALTAPHGAASRNHQGRNIRRGWSRFYGRWRYRALLRRRAKVFSAEVSCAAWSVGGRRRLAAANSRWRSWAGLAHSGLAEVPQHRAMVYDLGGGAAAADAVNFSGSRSADESLSRHAISSGIAHREVSRLGQRVDERAPLHPFGRPSPVAAPVFDGEGRS